MMWHRIGHAVDVSSAVGAGFVSNFFVPLLISILSLFIVFSFFYWLRMRKMKAKKKGKKFGLPVGGEHGAPPSTRFTDIAGVDEAVEELTEMVERLKNPERWEKWHIPPPKGALLYGPPGTGKTLLAKAVAGEAGVPFYAVSGSDFVEMYVGVGASRVRELFQNAKKEKNGAIIFIDEIDAVGRSRGGAGVDNVEHENSLNALLVELDGFTGRSNIVVLAATNRPELIDAALTRPGRLDRKVSVGLPDRAGRERILGVHMEGKPFSPKVDVGVIAGRTPGLSGADLSQIVHEACLNASRRDAEVVSAEDADHAVATVVMGKARYSAVVTPRDRTITAWHEAGHTVASMMLADADDPVSVTIVPRGPAGGFTWMSAEDRQYMTVSQMYARIIVAMAGRAAEEFLLDGEFTTGPSGDYSTATKVAYHMVAVYGMTGEGLISYGDGTDMSSLFAANSGIRDTVNNVLAAALNDARTIVKEHTPLLEDVVEGLLTNDTLTLPDLLALAGKHDIGAHTRTCDFPCGSASDTGVVPFPRKQSGMSRPDPLLRHSTYSASVNVDGATVHNPVPGDGNVFAAAEEPAAVPPARAVIVEGEGSFPVSVLKSLTGLLTFGRFAGRKKNPKRPV